MQTIQMRSAAIVSVIRGRSPHSPLVHSLTQSPPNREIAQD
ncbi:hypothetical protein [Laspinema palackyanum]